MGKGTGSVYLFISKKNKKGPRHAINKQRIKTYPSRTPRLFPPFIFAFKDCTFFAISSADSGPTSISEVSALEPAGLILSETLCFSVTLRDFFSWQLTVSVTTSHSRAGQRTPSQLLKHLSHTSSHLSSTIFSLSCFKADPAEAPPEERDSINDAT